VNLPIVHTKLKLRTAETIKTLYGGFGGVTNFTGWDGNEKSELPTEFLADTLNVYSVPGFRFVKVLDLSIEVWDTSPGEATIV
jgi:hypothetical protein